VGSPVEFRPPVLYKALDVVPVAWYQCQWSRRDLPLMATYIGEP
jgi:hypothetical protein